MFINFFLFNDALDSNFLSNNKNTKRNGFK